MRKIVASTLLLLLGASQQVRVSQSRLGKMNNNLEFAEVSSEAGTTHTCQYAINRIKAGPANFNTIVGSGQAYSDATFPSGYEMLRWDDMPGSYNLQSYANSCTYYRASSKLGNNLFGNDISPFDIT
jgi:hypothetical protein